MSVEQATAAPIEQLAPAARAGRRRRYLNRRLLIVGGPVVYLVALATALGAWGLPLARDELFLCLGLGLLAFSVSACRSWGVMLLEWLPFFGLLVAYDYLRGAVSVLPAQAHVIPQIDADKALFGGSVPTVWLQQHLWTLGQYHWYDYGIWVVYMTHFFTVWVVAAVLWRVARPRFRRYVVITVALTVAAFLTYWLSPAQPPWLAADGGQLPQVTRIVPLVWGQLGVPTMKSAYENDSFVNTVAAMPSLHAAYPLMLMLFFWSVGTRVRIVLGAYTLAMAFTLVYGGEHFVVDILIGWAMALAIYAGVSQLFSYSRAPARTASSTP